MSLSMLSRYGVSGFGVSSGWMGERLEMSWGRPLDDKLKGELVRMTTRIGCKAFKLVEERQRP